MSYKTHAFSTVYNDHSVCSDCGACTCHTPELVKMLCADVYAGSYNIFKHETSEKVFGVDENEAKFIFELRRTALHWVEAQETSKNMSPRQLKQFVMETENFLRTGKFSLETDAEDGVTIPISV